MTPEEKANFIPPHRGDIKDPQSFLKAIGRDCETVADKFANWDALFTTSPEKMEEMGIKGKMIKYIVASREWYRRGVDPFEKKIPVRAHRYKEVKAFLEKLERRKQGLE
ncbi:hypothetical protein HDV00_009848 [Rhizophlyctis rosea]|nr:hypothetical protein HDV00_009848 [Rhizophlyctis rosea]